MANIVGVHLYEISRTGKFKDRKQNRRDKRGEGVGEVTIYLTGTEFLFGIAIKFWRQTVVMTV